MPRQSFQETAHYSRIRRQADLNDLRNARLTFGRRKRNVNNRVRTRVIDNRIQRVFSAFRIVF